MKKITFITMQLKKFGGIERFISTLSEMFVNDYEVTIVANYGKKTDKLAFDLPSNVKVRFLSPALPDEVSLKNILKSLQFHRIPAEFIRRFKINSERKKVFKKFFKNLDTDIIITDRAEFNFCVQKYYHGNAKLIATDHNYHQNSNKYINTLINSLRTFDYLIVATEELRRFYAPKIGHTKCLQINNPLPKIPSKKSLLNTKNIIASGRFYPEKDFLTLVEVMRLVHNTDPEIHLFLAGDGPQKGLIEERIGSYGLQDTITLTGAITQEELASYYYKSSLFVMTSKTEAFGLVLAEAMSYGLPAIAFDRASGAREQITEQTGVLIKNADIEMMASQIIMLLNNRLLLHQYQNNLLHYVQRYDMVSIMEQWTEIL